MDIAAIRARTAFYERAMDKASRSVDIALAKIRGWGRHEAILQRRHMEATLAGAETLPSFQALLAVRGRWRRARRHLTEARQALWDARRAHATFCMGASS